MLGADCVVQEGELHDQQLGFQNLLIPRHGDPVGGGVAGEGDLWDSDLLGDLLHSNQKADNGEGTKSRMQTNPVATNLLGDLLQGRV